MKKIIKTEYIQSTIESFLFGLGLGLTIDFLIVPGLTIPNTLLHILTIILIVVMIIVQFQYIKTKECEKYNKELVDEWNRKHDEIQEKLAQLLEK